MNAGKQTVAYSVIFSVKHQSLPSVMLSWWVQDFGVWVPTSPQFEKLWVFFKKQKRNNNKPLCLDGNGANVLSTSTNPNTKAGASRLELCFVETSSVQPNSSDPSRQGCSSRRPWATAQGFGCCFHVGFLGFCALNHPHTVKVSSRQPGSVSQALLSNQEGKLSSDCRKRLDPSLPLSNSIFFFLFFLSLLYFSPPGC